MSAGRDALVRAAALVREAARGLDYYHAGEALCVANQLDAVLSSMDEDDEGVEQ